MVSQISTRPLNPLLITSFSAITTFVFADHSPLKADPCTDPKLDMKDAPVHVDAEKTFNQDIKDYVRPDIFQKMKAEDKQPGIISVSDFLSSESPQIELLSDNLANCIISNKPKVTFFGEIHQNAPDLVSLSVARKLMDKGEKVHFILEIPTNIDKPLKQFLNQEISEQKYGEALLQATLSQEDIAKLSENDKQNHIQTLRKKLETYPAQLHKMGIDFTCIDDPYMFQIKAVPNFSNTQKNSYQFNIKPMAAERDKRLAIAAAQVIESHNKENILGKFGLKHTHEIPNTSVATVPQTGTNTQYTMASLLADKYGKDKILSTMFATQIMQSTGLKFTDFDRVFNWEAKHQPLTYLNLLLLYPENDPLAQDPAYKEDLRILRELNKKP